MAASRHRPGAPRPVVLGGRSRLIRTTCFPCAGQRASPPGHAGPTRASRYHTLDRGYGEDKSSPAALERRGGDAQGDLFVAAEGQPGGQEHAPGCGARGPGQGTARWSQRGDRSHAPGHASGQRSCEAPFPRRRCRRFALSAGHFENTSKTSPNNIHVNAQILHALLKGNRTS